MNGVAIKDFFLQLGFDPSEVEKGLKGLESKFASFAKTANASYRISNKEAKDSLSLERQRFNLLKKINTLKSLGGETKGLHNKLRIKDPVKLKASQLQLDKMIFNQQKSNQIAKTKEEIKLANLKGKAALNANIEAARLNKLKQDELALNRANLQIIQNKKRAQQVLSVKESADIRNYRLRSRIDRSVSDLGSSLNMSGANKGISKTAEYQKFNGLKEQANTQLATAKTRAEFAKLEQTLISLNRAKTAVISRNKQLNRDFATTNFTTKALTDSLRNMARSYVSVFAIIGGAGMAAKVGQDLVSMRTSLLAATGSAEEAAASFEFVKNTSMELGVDLQSATKGFAQMGVAGKLAGMDMATTQEIFTGLAEASAAFGMSTVDSERALRAVTQMMNKGQVYAEELKQQLGESLPAAIPIAAKAMGVLPEELFKMMERGELVATEFLPKFTKELRSAVREGNALGEGLKTSRVAMQRFGTSFKLNVLEAFDAGAEKGLASFFNGLSMSLEELKPSFQFLGRFIGWLLEVLDVLIRVGTQLIRPFGMFFNQLTNGTSEASKGFLSMLSVLKTLSAAILVPIAYLEIMLDSISKVDNSLTLLANGVLTLIMMRMIGIHKVLKGIIMLSGGGLLLKGGGAIAGRVGGAIGMGGLLGGIGGISGAGSDWSSGMGKKVEQGKKGGFWSTLASKTLGLDDWKNAKGAGGKLWAGTKMAGRMAGKAFLPVSAGLLAYDAYQSYQETKDEPKGSTSSSPANITIGKMEFNIDGSKDPIAIKDQIVNIFNSQMQTHLASANKVS